MITLETGGPGAGKTLYCIDKLLRKLVGTTVKHEGPNGEPLETLRTIYTNINGLLLEHEKIGPGAPWDYDTKSGKWIQTGLDPDKHGLNNWHEWAKPGSIIVYDEVQKPWPLAAAGSRVPPCIEALETHRHMGVDFIVLTQHPMLIHANLVRLVGRHLHVRRMGNMGLAVVYEWDSASRTLLYKNALAKAPWRYDKSVFELYKSAELHTKTPRRMPSLVFGIIFGVGALFAIGPTAFARMSERINPTPAEVKADEPKPTAKAAASTGKAGPDGAAPAADVPAEVTMTGCAQVGSKAYSVFSNGKRKVFPDAKCDDLMQSS